ncbi:hypothetical protein [Rehaibacterium terrae]|uniref:hypothetical protein n=1 Tax=Rehaibacterium terrae TaxID=1341696 RepID=UPI00391BF920
MCRGLPFLLSALFACAAFAQAAPVPVAGELRAGAELVDPLFGVRARALGLERKVEMLQWRRRPEGGYAAEWVDGPVDGAGHDPAHANPPWPAFRSERWLSEHAVLAGRAVDPALFAALDGWQPLAVDAAALPPNLAVVFQPDGAGLTSSAVPAAPEIGDLRLRWSVLPEGPVHGQAVERDGRWVAAGEGSALLRGVGDDAVGEELPGLDLPPRMGSGWLPWAAGILVLVLLVLLAQLLRRRR